MTDIERVVQAVEWGLLTANTIKGLPQAALNLRECMAYYHVPGISMAFIDQAEIAWAGGYGVQDVDGELPVTEETIFQAASISKPIAAMITLKLVEMGLLDLDTDVNQILRSWQVPENEYTQKQVVTLRALLSHTAGLSVPGYRGYAAGAPLPTLQQVLNGESPANSEAVRVMIEPGKEFRYSGGGYVLIQQLLEDVTGRSLADLARELVFEKLGMWNSTFEHLLPEKYIPKAATAHRVDGNPVPGKWHTYPEGAPASLWSTPSDLARLIIEIIQSYHGESDLILSTEMTRHMLTPQTGWMGLGCVIVEIDGWRRFDHPGWNEGFHSYILGYPDARQGLVWMTNGENGKLLGHEVMRALAKTFGWPEFHPVEKQVARVNPALFPDYEGKYRYVDDPEFGVEIITDGEELCLQESHGGIRYRLFPGSETEFFCLPRSEQITFVKNGKGEAETMMIGAYAELERVTS